jgi:hypothetical protein
MIGNANNALNDVISTLIFGFIGFCMVKFGWPRPPLILGLTLGKIAENYLWISTAAYGAQMADVSDGHGIDCSHHLYRRLSDAQGEHGQGQIRASGRRGLVQQDRFIHYLSSCNFSEILMAEHQGL